MEEKKEKERKKKDVFIKKKIYLARVFRPVQFAENFNLSTSETVFTEKNRDSKFQNVTVGMKKNV